MPSVLAGLRRAMFQVSAGEASFARRGFAPTQPSRQQRLEHIGQTFLHGYNSAIELADPECIADALEPVASERRGFAYEGAGMGFALLDIVAPLPRRRFQRFLTGVGAPHRYMLHVGAGWALARTSPRLAWRLGPLDPLLQWLMFDGYGFHAGYFDPARTVAQQRRPRELSGCALKIFDQGLGRALWFVNGAEPDRVCDTIQSFPTDRHGDLWSGVGLAATYAGGIAADDLSALATMAGAFRNHLAQGASFAAKARRLAGNDASHTEQACRIICCFGSETCAKICDETVPSEATADGGLAYERWRAGIRRRFDHLASEEPAACVKPDACFAVTPQGRSSSRR